MKHLTESEHKALTSQWKRIDPNVRVDTIWVHNKGPSKAKLIRVVGIEDGGVLYRVLHPEGQRVITRRVALSYFLGSFLPTDEVMN